MALSIVKDAAALEARLTDGPTVVVGFFGDFSEASRKARPAFERWCADHPDQPAALVDVTSVPGVHARYGVTSVPSVVAVRSGKVERMVVGEQSPDFLSRALLGERSERAKAGAAPRVPHVTVFVTDTCPWCTRVKSYLREHHVRYAEVNVQRDASAMRKMVARSGQQGVPQLDIDGSFVVGFDKTRIDALLGLGRGA